MDSYSAIIPFQHQWKFTEEKLKELLNASNQNHKIRKLGIFSEFIEIQELPGAKYTCYLKFDEKKFVICFGVGHLKKQINAKFTIYIKSANYISPLKVFSFDPEDECFYFDICSSDDLFNPEKKYIVNGEITVKIKGMFLPNILRALEKSKTRKCMEKLLWDRDDKDFTILVGKEGAVKKEIKVHKLVLAIRSPVFDAMMKTNMKEKKEGKVEIIDFDAETVQAAVEYCYDQFIPNLFNPATNATSLFQFADKYDMENLKDFIELGLAQSATPENIVEITNASIISNAPKLRDFCFQMILQFQKMESTIDNVDILDTDFAVELLKKNLTFE